MTGPFPVRSPLSGRTALLTYEPYYGLKEKPFSLSVDPRFLYKSRSHAPIYDDLLAGIRRREGLIVLTGDIGTGKTTLCRAVLEGLDRKTFSTFVPDPFVSREDLLKMLLIDFGVMSVDDLKSGRLNGASRPDLSYPLYEFLNSLVPLQAFAVLIIDEAQNLSLPLLEEIRILSDLEAPEKLLQVVLVGQLEFQAKLKHPDMRQVDQRVSVRCNLEPLDREAVSSYIEHRLHVAGGTRDRVSFGPAAVDVIAQRSGGVPRLINLICDRALHRGHLARTSLIDADIARVAIIDLGLADASPPEIPTQIQELPPVPFALPEKPAPPGSRFADEPDEIVFEEHDLIHADHARPLDMPVAPAGDPVEEAPQAPPAPVAQKVDEGDRPLLFESRGSAWTGQGSPMNRRRWRRRSKRIAVIVGFIALALAGSYWQAQFDETTEILSAPATPPSPLAAPLIPFVSQTPGALPLAPDPDAGAPVPAPAASPALPDSASAGPGGIFAIDVALFNSTTRAARLVADLTAAGHRAYARDIDLGDRGHLFEVMVGPFAARADADGELARIRVRPGYDDARVVASAPPAP
jgi:type II secretory pathway predicted ATPase ExeA/cell division septation protein DedD